jgi:hypothetical protein
MFGGSGPSLPAPGARLAAGLDANAGGYRQNADYSSVVLRQRSPESADTISPTTAGRSVSHAASRREESAAAQQCAVPM